MEEEQADDLGRHVLVAGCFLLVDVHIAQLRVEMGGELVAYAGEKPILIEGVINDFTTEIEEHFIHDGYEGCPGGELFAFERNEKGEVIPQPVVEVVARQQLVVSDLAVEPFFEAQPLQRGQSWIFLIVPDLLPGAVLGPGCIKAFCRKMIGEGVANVKPQVILNKIGYSRSNQELEGPINEIVRLAIVDVYPKAKLVG